MFFILNTKSPDYFLDSDKYVCSETIVALLTISHSSKINGYLNHHRVSPPLKKIQTVWVGCDSPLLTKMVPLKTITICKGLSHQITQQNSLQRAGVP